jgi:hypothetical protein
MNRHPITLLAVTAFIAFTAIAIAGSNSVANLNKEAGEIPKEKDQLSVQAALIEFQKVAQMEAYFDASYGVAIFPTIGKGGLGVGGAHGAGWVFRQGK